MAAFRHPADAAGSAAATLRDAVAADMAAVHQIYAHHVREGLGSFEEVPPDQAEMERRWAALVARKLPFLVAELDGDVAGYAYAAPYRERKAYRFTIEDSIYVSPQALGRGIGRALLSALIERCTALGYRQMVAVIGGSENSASITVHRSLGFLDAGALKAVGWKFDAWVDTVFMQRPLGPQTGDPERDPDTRP